MSGLALALVVTASVWLLVLAAFFAKLLKRLERTLDRMEAATFVVRDNLADSVSRADATDGPEGAAADAALRTGDTVEAIHERQDRRTFEQG